FGPAAHGGGGVDGEKRSCGGGGRGGGWRAFFHWRTDSAGAADCIWESGGEELSWPAGESWIPHGHLPIVCATIARCFGGTHATQTSVCSCQVEGGHSHEDGVNALSAGEAFRRVRAERGRDNEMARFGRHSVYSTGKLLRGDPSGSRSDPGRRM